MIHSDQPKMVEVDRTRGEAEPLREEKRAPFTHADMVFLGPPFGIFTVWLLSLRGMSLQQMNDLGLVSIFSPLTLLALALMMLSFCASLQRPQLRTPILLLHICLLVFMLYGVTTLIEQAPRFSVVYRHAGYVEYIMRTGTVDPNLDAYFNWPGFFILSAFVTRISGYPSILSYAVWAPVFLNLLYFGPLFSILSSVTTNKHLMWLALWFFYLTNWIGQDYYSPQGLAFFLYLVIIALLLRWFRVQAGTEHMRWADVLSNLPSFMGKWYRWLIAPDPGVSPVQPRLRWTLLALMLLIFAFVVSSHPLTPFFVLASVTALVLFRRCTPAWLPVVMAIMTGAWIFVMTRTFLAGHLSWVTGDIGQPASIISQNVGSHLSGDPEHELIAQLRVLATLVIWGCALIGCLRRARQGYRDANAILLAIAPFPLLIIQPYGGEMLLRIYLFSLPLVAFFVASLFYAERAASGWQTRGNARPTHARFALPRRLLAEPRWKSTLMTGFSMLLLAGFLFTRYGNERQDYMTYAEVAGVHYLYSIAQPGSIFIAGTDGTPWEFQDFEKYNLLVLTDSLLNAVINQNVSAITQFIRSEKHTFAYLIFTRSQEATLESTFGLVPGTLDRLQAALIASGQYKLVYGNPDARILLFTEGAQGGAS